MNLLFNMNIIVNIAQQNHPCKIYTHIYLSHIKSSDKKLPLNRKLLSVSVSVSKGNMDHLRPKRSIKLTTKYEQYKKKESEKKPKKSN